MKFFAFPTMLICGLLYAQPAPLQFEVASIKPSAGDSRGMSFRVVPGGLRIDGATLKALVAFAYELRDFQVSGGPGWINTDRFDINARAERPADTPPAAPEQSSDEQRKTSMEQMRERMKSLLAERFQLVIHRDSKEQSVYALVLGKNGAKLKEVPALANRMMRMGHGTLNGQSVEMQTLAGILSRITGRPVIDKTGLKGTYDIKLEWTPDPGQGPPPMGADAPPAPDPNGPSIFVALQEQLGLRLESQKGPVEHLVIDRVEKPSEN